MTLVAIAEEGSFQRAAERLNCVPSAISNRMQKLSDQAGVDLFTGDGRRMALTQAGLTMTRMARQILVLSDQVYHELHGPDHTVVPFRLGVIDTVASLQLPTWLRALRKANPSLIIQLETGHSIPLVDRVVSGHLDAAFVAGPWENPMLTQEMIIPEEICLILPHECRTIDDLANRTAFVFSCPCTYRSRLEQWLSASSQQTCRFAEVNSLDTMIGCVAGGLGFAAVPKSALSSSPHRKWLRALELPKATAHIPTVLVRNTTKPAHEALSTIIAHIDT